MTGSPDSVSGRDLDLLDVAAVGTPSALGALPPVLAPVIGAPAGVRSAGSAGIVLATTSTPTGASGGGHHESVFAGGTYELEHPVNHLGNDLRNDAFSNRDDEDSGYVCIFGPQSPWQGSWIFLQACLTQL